MKMLEYQHRSEGGGNMVLLPNEVFDHGEEVLVVSKKELVALLEELQQLLFAGDGPALNRRLTGLRAQVTDLKEGHSWPSRRRRSRAH